MPEMISLEEARALVLSHAAPLPVETVPVLEAVGRVAAADLKSDIDISPFAHSAMDGFAVRAAELAEASQEAPVELDVVAEIAAGDVFEGSIEAGQCVRIMTGAPMPDDADSVVKYEIVDVVTGDGKPGSRVAFSAPTAVRSNVREAGDCLLYTSRNTCTIGCLAQLVSTIIPGHVFPYSLSRRVRCRLHLPTSKFLPKSDSLPILSLPAQTKTDSPAYEETLTIGKFSRIRQTPRGKRFLMPAAGHHLHGVRQGFHHAVPVLAGSLLAAGQVDHQVTAALHAQRAGQHLSLIHISGRRSARTRTSARARRKRPNPPGPRSSTRNRAR